MEVARHMERNSCGIDPTSPGLHRVGEEGRCIEAGSSEDASGDVSIFQIHIYNKILMLSSSAPNTKAKPTTTLPISKSPSPI